MSADIQTALAAVRDVLARLDTISATFGEMESVSPEDAEAWLAQREELTGQLEALDAEIGNSLATSAAEADKKLFFEYLEYRNRVLNGVLERDREIIGIARERMVAVSEEMAALQNGKQAMTGYRQGGLLGSFVDRTA